MKCTIIIPCFNEEKFIGACLESIAAQDFPKDKLEVLIVDGMSTDATRAIALEYAARLPYITVLPNPGRITPRALNIGIQAARGDVIMRMDAHAAYGSDYVSKCLRYLDEYNADNVGGAMITRPREQTVCAMLIVDALTSRFGVGDSDFRTGVSAPTETDTVFGGCYRRRVFDTIGLFNENLMRGQDMEFNIRLKNIGGRIILAPDIKCSYYPRGDFMSFVKNNFVNGLWAVKPFLYARTMPVSLRHLIPAIFVAVLVSGVFVWRFFSEPRPLLALALAYASAAIFFAARAAYRSKAYRRSFLLPLMFFCLHVSYGSGSLAGFLTCVPRAEFWGNLIHIAAQKIKK